MSQTEKNKTTNEAIADLLYGDGSIKSKEIVEAEEIATHPVDARNDKTQEDHKSEILATRKGGFGSSDAWMLIDIATIGKVMPKHYKRLAVFEGLLEPDNFTTPEMETGNQREKEIFDYYKKKHSEVFSVLHNPIYYDSKYFTELGFKCFSHIDMVEVLHQDIRLNNIIEIKTSKKETYELLNDYDAQLKWHCLMAYKNEIVLIHYQEKHDGSEFNPANIITKTITYTEEDLNNFLKNVKSGLQIIKEFLENQKENDYKDLKEHCKDKKRIMTLVHELPELIVNKIRVFLNYLKMVKEREQEAEQIKETIFKLMTEKGIYSWEFEELKFTRVPESISTSFNSKKFKEDHLELYQQYLTETKRKSYLKITLKEGVENGI